MDKTLLLVVIFLGAFSLVKAVMLIMVGLAMKPKVDENGNIIMANLHFLSELAQ